MYRKNEKKHVSRFERRKSALFFFSEEVCAVVLACNSTSVSTFGQRRTVFRRALTLTSTQGPPKRFNMMTKNTMDVKGKATNTHIILNNWPKSNATSVTFKRFPVLLRTFGPIVIGVVVFVIVVVLIAHCCDCQTGEGNPTANNNYNNIARVSYQGWQRRYRHDF